ncbi:MAG: hypothetical protein L3K17_04195 [Thermoplasmata archaeon]|nr:hypothetical protein [Thermoplasmata archaeon]
MTSGGDLATYAVVLAVFVLIIGRRVVMMVRGTPFSLARLVGVAVFYVALCALALAFDLLLVPWWLVAADVGAIVVVTAGLPPYIESQVSVYRGPGGGWYYRLGAWVPLAYVALFVARLGIEFGVLGINPFVYSASVPNFTTVQLAILAGVDGLFAFSTGLMLARSFAVYRVYQRAAAAESTPSAAPLR